MRHATVRSFAFITALLLLPGALAAQGSDADRFDGVIAEALRAYNEGEYDKALDLYFEAKVINDLAEIDYSIARCYHNLNKCKAAGKFYEKAKSRIAELPEAYGAKIDQYLTELPQCVEAQETVEPKDTTPVDTQQAGGQPNEPPSDVPPPQTTDEPGLDWLSLGVMGGGAAVALAGLGIDLASQSLADDHEKYSVNSSTGTIAERRAKVADLEDQIATRKTVAIALYSVGGAAIITGVVLMVMRAPSSDESADQTVWTLQPVLGQGGAGVVLGGRF